MKNTLNFQNKKQTYLLIIFFVLIITTVIIFFSGKERQPRQFDQIIELPIREVNINWDLLSIMKELRFTSFSTIPEFEEKPGRENPFSKSRVIKVIEEETIEQF